MKRLHIEIFGCVQGIGFRPFVFRLAKSLNLKGYVRNTRYGAEIEVEGEEAGAFIERLKGELPPGGIILQLRVKELEPAGFREFSIEKSSQTSTDYTVLPPDAAMCPGCEREMFERGNRRYLYPFTNCTACGARFSIISTHPYDRHRTSMADFPMCPSCLEEYSDPSDRRFHAQTISCPHCGPSFTLYDSRGRALPCDDPVKEAALQTKKGKIVAVKGMGGFHLACSALDEGAVERLRKRKRREGKPFALMVPDIPWLERICRLDEASLRVLKSRQAPIVLLEKKESSPVAPGVAPNNRYFGVMLPYSGVHKLLLRFAAIPLVMTSGNFSQEPIIFDEKEALQRLSDVADFFLIHNRKIVSPVDDSIVQIIKGKPVVLRRARGYVPLPFVLPQESPAKILAVGGDLKSTFCMLRENYAFLSQHIGDLEDLPSQERFHFLLEHFKQLLNFSPDLVVHDLHPDYFSTRIAESMDLPTVALQHHKCHIASVAAEFQLREEIIGFAFDGTGYGEDGKVWGGEVFFGTPHRLRRAGKLREFLLLTSEKAVREPWRVALSLLLDLGVEPEGLEWAEDLEPSRIEVLKKAHAARVNSPMSSSMGRLFDAVSSLLRIKHFNTFEAEAAMALEAAASRTNRSYDFKIEEEGGLFIMDWKELILQILADLKAGEPAGLIAGKFHNAVAKAVAEIAERLREATGINRVILSGGVFQNRLLSERTLQLLQERGFAVYFPSQVPPNDGGISLGQAYTAYLRILEEGRC